MFIRYLLEQGGCLRCVPTNDCNTLIRYMSCDYHKRGIHIIHNIYRDELEPIERPHAEKTLICRHIE